MKKLMMTTALVAMTSMGAFAQTATTPTTGAETSVATQNVPAFVASNFTGKNLYTLDHDDARAVGENRTAAEDRAAGTATGWQTNTAFTDNRDAWEDVGNIADVVMTSDGDVRGVLIDVGGFLGIGARTVMVNFEDLNFLADDTTPEDLSDFVVVTAMSRDQLEALPEWDEDQLTMGYESRNAGNDTAMTNTAATGTTAEPMTANNGMAREGYTDMPLEERTAERLIGANAVTADGEEIATVDDLVLDADSAATHVIMDVGGFLGMGTHTVAIDINEVDILWNDADGDVMVQISMTEDQLRAMPEHEG